MNSFHLTLRQKPESKTSWLTAGAVARQIMLWLAMAAGSELAVADDWMTWPSTFTHAVTGQRIDQYALAEQPQAPQRADFSRSGYRQFRSTLQAGQSADNLNIVEQWGQPVIPYEHWRFPFRPYGVPYDAWGPQAPYGITNGWFGFGGPGVGVPGVGGPGVGGPGVGNPGMGGTNPSTYPGALPSGSGQGLSPHGPWGNGNWSNGNWGNNAWGGGVSQPPWNAVPGFPLTPPYANQPWFDGSYPETPPLIAPPTW